MHEAISTLHGRLYTAEEFDRQSDEVKAAHRPSRFTCPECGGRAFFRPRSADGVAACFGARHTREDCPAKSAPRADTPTPGVETVPALDNSGAVLVLDWDGIPGTATPSPTMTHAADPTQDGPTRLHDPAAGTVAREHTTRKLRALLGRLNADPAQADSPQPIQLHPGHTPQPLREILLTPEQITADHIGQLHLIWGTLATAERNKDGSAFLRCKNPHGQRIFLIRLTRHLATAVWTHLSWTADIPRAHGTTFLAGGTLHQHPGRAPYLSLDSPTQIALRTPTH